MEVRFHCFEFSGSTRIDTVLYATTTLHSWTGNLSLASFVRPLPYAVFTIYHVVVAEPGLSFSRRITASFGLLSLIVRLYNPTNANTVKITCRSGRVSPDNIRLITNHCFMRLTTSTSLRIPLHGDHFSTEPAFVTIARSIPTSEATGQSAYGWPAAFI